MCSRSFLARESATNPVKILMEKTKSPSSVGPKKFYFKVGEVEVSPDEQKHAIRSKQAHIWWYYRRPD